MRQNMLFIKSSVTVFVGSFCLMVIELVASRILAPHIGVSLYSWTSIIGVIMAGIASGNYLGGKIADRFPSPRLIVAVFLLGSLTTIGILPVARLVTLHNWFASLPVILNFTMKTVCIFFLPAVILSMVSPAVIKLTLADLGKTGGIVGTIYAWSTAGSILGTFMTGFFFILWFGTRMIIWLIAGALVLSAAASWFSWQVSERWKLSVKNASLAVLAIMVAFSGVYLSMNRETWLETYTKESSYYAISVTNEDEFKVLILDHLVHSYSVPGDPSNLHYAYLKVFSEVVSYLVRDNPAPSLLHLGGGGYSFPRYMEAVYPGSKNEVVEIDPAVTEIAYRELGLSPGTSVETHNMDARFFLNRLEEGGKYDFVVGDVFNDKSTPYHLTTVEFDTLVKRAMTPEGVYLINIIDDYQDGRYMPSFLLTLKQVFRHVYLIGTGLIPENAAISTFVIAATDREVDFQAFRDYVTKTTGKYPYSYPRDNEWVDDYLSQREPVLLTDDYAPTDILVAEIFE